MRHDSPALARVPIKAAADELPDHLRGVKIRTAAAALDCSQAFIYQLIADGRLRTVKIGHARRVPVTEIERLLAEGTS